MDQHEATCDLFLGERRSRTEHVQPGWANKHVKPLVETEFMVETHLPGASPCARPTGKLPKQGKDAA